MIVRYVWFTEPDITKVYDTDHVWGRNPLIRRNMTREELEERTPNDFEKEFASGRVLWYEVQNEQ